MQPVSGRGGDGLQRPDLRGAERHLRRLPRHRRAVGRPVPGRPQGLQRAGAGQGRADGGHPFRCQRQLPQPALRVGALRDRREARGHAGGDHTRAQGGLPRLLSPAWAPHGDRVQLPLRGCGAGLLVRLGTPHRRRRGAGPDHRPTRWQRLPRGQHDRERAGQEPRALHDWRPPGPAPR
ncbi:hypothetical protein D3C76_1151850 [compost metagenome]